MRRFARRRFPTKAEVRTVACPFCHAKKQKPCVLFDGTAKTTNHQDRVAAYYISRKSFKDQLRISIKT